MDKRELKKQWKQAEAERLKASLPLSMEDLKGLFEFIDRPNPPECTHQLIETSKFLQQKGLDFQKILPWLRENGGYCDCEVIYNVADKYGEIVGFEPKS